MRSRTAEQASYQAFEALCEPRGPAPGRASRLRQRLWLRAVGTLGRELIKLGLGHAKGKLLAMNSLKPSEACCR